MSLIAKFSIAKYVLVELVAMAFRFRSLRSVNRVVSGRVITTIRPSSEEVLWSSSDWMTLGMKVPVSLCISICRWVLNVDTSTGSPKYKVRLPLSMSKSKYSRFTSLVSGITEAACRADVDDISVDGFPVGSLTKACG